MTKTKLEVLAEFEGSEYSSTFIQRYLLIKINNLAKYQDKEWDNFIQHLAQFYSQYKVQQDKFKFTSSPNEASLLAQILLASNTYKYLTKEMLDEFL